MSDLMDFLQRNAANKGVMATLRYALADKTEIRAWPLLAGLKGIGPSQQARAVRTVAALFAYHPQPCDEGNMGTVCRRLCGADEHTWESTDGQGRTVAPGPMSRRFMYLLSADREEICARTARVVLYAKSKEIPVNYATLEKDLASWPRARAAWASTFWGTEQTKEKVGEETA
ncbi:type I-E CRISPR-associated protein Cse2/CasB [Desulfobulbus oralis]|uniref:Type I-E CRISPR-associated protein Cse2/CasB n=1 Tax=Desulfobulbus oralis TaxID=1986146 RepID=A0A2L1GMI2_9BACT|nr:type I-E CRISPR-associated protein Cse2/CasB [Desulfobulbus oralis]AVD70889.1 type I-E CRISPR-associated protein Cse2/CasB [Desulfobulbus oralis]